ncbi:MAG: tetratricopeptide repeat protein [Rhodospirillaceae bacterium]
MTEKDASPAPEPKKKKPEKDVELDGLMAEIESDLREDELKRVWRRYGSTFVTIAVVFVLGVGAFEAWRAYQSREHNKIALMYDEGLAAASDKRYDEAKAKFAEAAKSGDKPYADLARLTDAGIRVEQNDIDGAIALYGELAADTKADPLFRDMALVLKALHSVDRDDPKKLEAELAPLTKASTFKHSAIEITALLAAKQGDTARAAQLAQSLIDDPAAPRNMRGRATELAALYKAGVVPASLPPPALDAGKAPSVMDLVAPAAEAEPEPARPAAKPAPAKP